jgi:hypothetical protein
MPDYERFVGREAQIKELKEALESRHPLIALDGLGGSEKRRSLSKLCVSFIMRSDIILLSLYQLNRRYGWAT